MIPQNIKTDVNANWKICDITISGIAEGDITTRINFKAFDASSRVVEEHTVIRSKEDHNDFWNKFDTGKAAYDELKKDLELTGIIDSKVEEEFVNVIKETI